MKFDTFRQVLGAAVPNGGTITFGYPAGRNNGFYRGGFDHKLFASGAVRTSPVGFTIAFGANIVVTYLGATTIPAGAEVGLQVNYPGDYSSVDTVTNRDRASILTPILLPLGAVATADADGVTTTQGLVAATPATIAGALAAGGVATFDVPRNVVAAWTNTAVLTVTGTDEFGAIVRESSASGTSFAGKKAFKTVTSATVSADVTGLTIGTGNVLGMPFLLFNAGQVRATLLDAAADGAATVVAGDTAVATATTGDVRGTLAPSTAPNGTRVFAVLMLADDLAYRGAPQFAG